MNQRDLRVLVPLWQIPTLFFYLLPDEKDNFPVDPVCTAKVPSVIQWRGTESTWNFLCREYGGMPYLLKPLPEIFAVWKNPLQTQRALPELSLARTSPVDMALPEGKDGFLFSTTLHSSYRPGTLLYESF